MKMAISKKILLVTLPFFILFGGILLYLSISNGKKQGEQSLAIIHSTMMQDKKEKLTDLVRNTFEILRTQYETSHDTSKIAEEYKQQLQSVVNLAFSSIQAVYDDPSLNANSKRAEALKIIKAMRYNGNNYLWVNDMQPSMVMHPMKPSLDGKNLASLKDSSGKHLFTEMVKVCTEKGEGFVDYMWPKPGQDQAVPKLSYVRLFKPWNWVIGTGVYLETAEQQFKEKAKTQISNLRFGPEGKDYFFIIDTDLKMVMHPIKPALNGKDLSDFKDSNNKKLFQEMVNISKSDGGGFVDYMWPKPDKEKPVSKLSYVQLFKQWGWIVGTGIYIDDIEEAMAQQKNDIDLLLDKGKTTILMIVGIILIMVTAIISFVVSKIARPIRETGYFFKDISEGDGDLTARIKVASSDELGEMAHFFNIFADKLQGMVSYIADESVEINKSAGTLSLISSNLTEVAGETLSKASSADSAVERMSSNMNTVAGNMEEAATNVNAVGSAIEEMTSTINDIAETSEKARSITSKAVTQASEASVSVDQLGTAAMEITGVLDTITEISQQVDLLALNATIEAARAGDAGKGFAVVASEIKDLASQTAQAADQIKDRINSIQTTTTATVSVIQDISEVVGENSHVVNTIATAVEEQSATAQEISRNIDQVSMFIQEVNQNVHESSEISTELTSQIRDINLSSDRLNDSATEVDKNSKSLNTLAQSLDRLVSSYKYK